MSRSRRTPPPASTIDDLLHPSPDAGPSRRTAAWTRQRLLSSASSASTPSRTRTPAMLPPSPPRLSRANSANGGGTRDQWHVTNGTGPLTSIEGTTAPGKVAGVDGEPSVTLRGAADADDPSSRPPVLPTSRSWGGGLLSTAVNTAVFGAAVGLTAYRLWSDWGRRDDSGPPPESPTVSSHDLPPAYESLADSSVRSHPHSYGGHRDSSSRSSMSPTTRSTASTPVKRYRPARMRRKRPQRPSIADLVAVASTSASPLRPERASASSASVSVVSGTTAPTAPDSLSVTRETPDLSVRSDAGEDEEDEEMNTRLDVMAQRLQGLITEGRRALDSTPIIEETSPSPEALRFKGLEAERDEEEPDVVEDNEVASQAPDTDTGGEAVEMLRDGSSTLEAPSAMSGTSRSSSTASLTRSSTSGSLARRSQRSVSQGSTPNSSVRGIAAVCPVPPLPWSKVHKGPAPTWVQRPFNAKDSPAASPERASDPSKAGAVGLEPSKPGAVGIAPPDRNGAVTPPPQQPQPPRPESVTSPTSRASRIPRPGGGHSRTSSTSTGVGTRPETASPAPSIRRQSSRQSTRPQSTMMPQSPTSAPAPPQRKMHRSSSIKDAIASLERSAAAAAIPVSSSPQLTPSQRSKIPIRRSIGGGPLSPPLPPPAEATDAAPQPQPPLPTPTVN